MLTAVRPSQAGLADRAARRPWCSYGELACEIYGRLEVRLDTGAARVRFHTITVEQAAECKVELAAECKVDLRPNVGLVFPESLNAV